MNGTVTRVTVHSSADAGAAAGRKILGMFRENRDRIPPSGVVISRLEYQLNLASSVLFQSSRARLRLDSGRRMKAAMDLALRSRTGNDSSSRKRAQGSRDWTLLRRNAAASIRLRAAVAVAWLA